MLCVVLDFFKITHNIFLSRALSEVFYELSANHTSQLSEVLSSLVELVAIL